MARPKNPIPAYLHHASDRARVAWTDTAGIRRFKMLPGPFDSAESKAAYRTFLAEMEAAPHHAHPVYPNGITINEVLLADLNHADRFYVDPEGRPTDEPRHVRTVCQYLRELYGNTPAAAFGPLAIKAVRKQFVVARWCRNSVNRQTARVVQIFKWAASEELVPAAVYQALCTVTGLRKDRSSAHETEPVRPVEDAIVDATLPFLNRFVRGLVEFQRLTGCRPGEAMALRRSDKRLAALTADMKTITGGDPGVFIIGGQGVPQKDTVGVLTAALSRIPDQVTHQWSFSLGKYRGLTFGIERYPGGATDVYLEGQAIRRDQLSRDSQGAKAVTNALSRIIGSYDVLGSIRRDRSLAQTQLEDYRERVGRPFAHTQYLEELTCLRDRLKVALSGTLPRANPLQRSWLSRSRS